MAPSLLALLAIVATLVSNVVAEPRVASFPVSRRETRGESILRKRQQPQLITVNEQLVVGEYVVQVGVGTPPQQITLQLDTGSADVWMFSPQACQGSCFGGTFDPDKSSTFAVDNSLGQFQITYVTPGSGVSGEYFSDNLELGSIKLTNFTMALAASANQTSSGIIGVAYSADESIVPNSQGNVEYPGFVDTMVSEGVISSHSYSLYLDDIEAGAGSILFGGYDTAKYYEPLTVLDVQLNSQSGLFDSFYVIWSLLGISDSSSTTLLNLGDFPLIADLDSGTSLATMPPDIFAELVPYFGIVNDSNYGWIVPCSNADWEGTIDVGFGEGSNIAILQIPFSQLVIPVYQTDGSPATLEDGSQACFFAFQPNNPGDPLLLGDTLLRNAYVIYDLEANQVAVAQLKYNTTDSNIQEIPAGNNLASIIGSGAVAATSGSAPAPAGTGQPAPGRNGTKPYTYSVPTMSGTISEVNGVTTTLSVATNLAGSIGSNPIATGGTSSSSKAAAAAVYSPGNYESILPLAAFISLFAGGAVFMAFF